MSNNAAEQEIRPIAVGRHSWTFAGSDEGGRPATAIYKQADPHARINDVDPPLRGLRVRFKSCSRVTELSQHEADGGKFQERESVAIEIFPILGETATTIQPCDGSLDDPTFG